MKKTVVQEIVDTILGSTKIVLMRKSFASVLNFDVLQGTDYVCGPITGNCLIHIINAKDGDSGIIELVMDGTGGYTITFGNEFTKRLSDAFDTTASKDNFITWQKINTDIIYSIQQVQ